MAERKHGTAGAVFLFLTGLLVTSTACCPPPSEAEKAVLSMFDAYSRRDQAAVQALMAPGALNILDGDGEDTGRKICDGLLMTCLESDYGAFRGSLISREAKCHACFLDSQRGVRLRTVWTNWDTNLIGGRRTLCQEFRVSEESRSVYRVRYVWEAKSCD